MRRKAQKRIRIRPEHAAHALHALIAQGKIKANDVTNALKRREAMISDLRKKLAALEGGIVSAGTQIRRTVARRAKRRLSAATRAKFRLMGAYMGTVRPLSKAAKAKVKAIREKSGVRAAIAAAKKMAK